MKMKFSENEIVGGLTYMKNKLNDMKIKLN